MYIYQRYYIKAQREHFMKLKQIKKKTNKYHLYIIYIILYNIYIYYACASTKQRGEK